MHNIFLKLPHQYYLLYTDVKKDFIKFHNPIYRTTSFPQHETDFSLRFN